MKINIFKIGIAVFGLLIIALINGQSKADWLPNYNYFSGNIITISGASYMCISGHTSYPSTFDIRRWGGMQKSDI
ncbi:MAG: hypothetical protein WCP92_08930 [bacterium]